MGLNKEIVNNDESRAKFVKYTFQFIKRNNFDGLEIYWPFSCKYTFLHKYTFHWALLSGRF